MKAYRGRYDKKRGSFGIVWKKADSVDGKVVEIPCGKCVGCRLQRARQWSLRIVQEMRCYSDSAFLTLTYRDDALPKNGSLDKRHLQLFMKVLRKRRDTGLRFFACGEYGEITQRPHYHILLLNTGFHDRKPWKVSGDHQLYVSAECSNLWSFGDHYIGEVNVATASYVAGYAVKKIKSVVVDELREPEFRVMSRRPGIGHEWFLRYGADAYRHDCAINNGMKVSLPRYYDTKFKEYAWDVDALKRERKCRAKIFSVDNTPERRRVREKCDELMLAATYRRDAL